MMVVGLDVGGHLRLPDRMLMLGGLLSLQPLDYRSSPCPGEGLSVASEVVVRAIQTHCMAGRPVRGGARRGSRRWKCKAVEAEGRRAQQG
jgi:hypothetical protein